MWAAWLSVWLALAQDNSPKDARPNIVFFFADDQRADTIAALGNGQIKTPHLDSLVKEGTSFNRAYIMGGLQGAVCVPSRAQMLSGKGLFRIQEQLKNTTTWPLVLRQAGYLTFATGKWHNGAPSLALAFPNARSIHLGGMSNQFGTPMGDMGPEGKLINQRQPEAHCSEIFADEAITFLKQAPQGKPLAIYIAFKSPHDPRQAPKKFQDLYDPAKITLPANYLPEHPFNNGELLIRDERLEKWPRSKAAIQKHLADYYAIISHQDAQIGRVLEVLKKTGRFGNTVIVFAADNGLAIGSHGLMGKQNVYEHSSRIPLVVAGPGVKKGARTDAFCYNFDLYPTFAELANAQVPKEVEGKSLVRVLRGETDAHRQVILTSYRGFMRGIRDGRWKLIVTMAINKKQLFDLQNDPEETKDLSSDPAHGETVARLTGLLELEQKEFGDSAPLRNEKPLPAKIDLSKVPPEGKKK
ncbi:MAG: DUF4976 domain-containing protein [Gemmataceae bacterium]|nr:DUF4976 domain-containing protein [Gemmataceae bacterium]